MCEFPWTYEDCCILFLFFAACVRVELRWFKTHLLLLPFLSQPKIIHSSLPHQFIQEFAQITASLTIHLPQNLITNGIFTCPTFELFDNFLSQTCPTPPPNYVSPTSQSSHSCNINMWKHGLLQTQPPK